MSAPSRRFVLLALGLAAATWIGISPVLAEEPKPTPPAPATTPAWTPMLWVVEGKPRVYLFGTMHVPDKRFVEWPRVVKDAHAAADVVFTEVRNEELDPATVHPRLLLPAERPIEKVLPEKTLDRLHAYLESRELPGTAFDRYKPWVIAIRLPQLDYLSDQALREAMDKLVYAIAQRDGREVGGLETVNEQLALFDALTDEQQTKMVDGTIQTLEDDAKAGTNSMQGLVDAYLRGDADAVQKRVEAASAGADEDTKKFMESLIDRRNAVMAQRLFDRAKEKPDKTLFVGVGATHFPGEKGILALLAKKGWKARRVAIDEKIPPRQPATTAPVGTPAMREPVPAK